MRVLRSSAVERVLEYARRQQQRLGRRLHPELHPRHWSNAQLRQFAPRCTGDVVNVSGWQDADKEGAAYRTYFSSCRSYAITNYANGARGQTDAGALSIPFDLEAPVPPSLAQAFDVVFCHTVLEHVFDHERAFAALRQLSRDVVVVVVPFLQDEHEEPGSYGDFWRYTSASLRRLLERDGMRLVHLSSNDNVWWPIYLFAVACRDVDRWRGVMPATQVPESLGRRLCQPQATERL